MVYRTNVRWMFLLCCLISLNGCMEDIKIDTDEISPKLVVYGGITDELKLQELEIVSSNAYTSPDKFITIQDAKVTVTSNKGEVLNFKADKSSPGVYRTVEKVAGVPGETYHLKVEVDFDKDGTIDHYEADATMPSKVNLETISVTPKQIGENHYFSFNISAQDPRGENYYMCLYKINTSKYSRITHYLLFNDLAIDGRHVQGMPLATLRDTKEKQRYTDEPGFASMPFVTTSDQVNMYLSNIDKGFFNFLKQCQNQRLGENPFFGGPPNNFSTNISSGGIGYFTAYTVSSAQTVVGN